MTNARSPASPVAFDPGTVEMLETVFDEVWSSIGHLVGGNVRQIIAARIQLATIVVDLAKDGQLGPLQVTRTAARLMRQIHKKR